MSEEEFNKIKQIHERRKFAGFWEAFEYLTNASYCELDALMISSKLFDGDIWSRVVNVLRVKNNYFNVISSGSTTMTSFSGTSFIQPSNENYNLFGRLNDSIDNLRQQINYQSDKIEDLVVIIYLMTDEAYESCKPIYKAYSETRDYEEQPLLDGHIKTLKVKLTTELAIKMIEHAFPKLK